MDHTRESYFDSFHQTHNGELKNSYYNPFMVKHRRRTSKMQLKVLEKTFETNVRPDAALRKVLGEQLGMTPRSVQIWFQNRRAKVKKTKKDDVDVGDKKTKYDNQHDAGLYKRTNSNIFTPNFADEILYHDCDKNDEYERKFDSEGVYFDSQNINATENLQDNMQNNAYMHISRDDLQRYTQIHNTPNLIHQQQNMQYSQSGLHENIFVESEYHTDKNNIKNDDYYQKNCNYNFTHYLDHDYHTDDNFYRDFREQQNINECNNGYNSYEYINDNVHQNEEMHIEELNSQENNDYDAVETHKEGCYNYDINHEYTQNEDINVQAEQEFFKSNYKTFIDYNDDINKDHETNTYENNKISHSLENATDKTSTIDTVLDESVNKDDTKCIISPLSTLSSPQKCSQNSESIEK